MGGNRTDLRIEKCRTRQLSITHESLVGGVTRTEGFLRLEYLMFDFDEDNAGA